MKPRLRGVLRFIRRVCLVISPAVSNRFQRNTVPEPFEILPVVRQQAADAVGMHGGDDIGIVNLFAPDLVVLQQFELA